MRVWFLKDLPAVCPGCSTGCHVNVYGKPEVIIGKQRHGPTGTVPLQFEANVTRFSDLAQEGRYPART